ncbi:MAG: DUF934 domain-containing protein [Myxococcales bacterium]|nr:DUF934 domain-containing protein [Myxococcales bacterium]
MRTEMILDRQVVPARFNIVEHVNGDFPTTPDTAIPQKDWLRLRNEGMDVRALGVIVCGDEDIAALEPVIHEATFVALRLPKFSDGRIYSHAYRIRTLWNYRGTILVYGDVLRDQLLYLSRVGINGFYMRSDQDLAASLSAFSLYSEFWQYR